MNSTPVLTKIDANTTSELSAEVVKPVEGTQKVIHYPTSSAERESFRTSDNKVLWHLVSYIN